MKVDVVRSQVNTQYQTRAKNYFVQKPIADMPFDKVTFGGTNQKRINRLRKQYFKDDHDIIEKASWEEYKDIQKRSRSEKFQKSVRWNRYFGKTPYAFDADAQELKQIHRDLKNYPVLTSTLHTRLAYYSQNDLKEFRCLPAHLADLGKFKEIVRVLDTEDLAKVLSASAEESTYLLNTETGEKQLDEFNRFIVADKLSETEEGKKYLNSLYRKLIPELSVKKLSKLFKTNKKFFDAKTILLIK